MKLIPKFKIGSKIRKAQKGLDTDELGIPGANFVYKKKDDSPNIPGPDERVINFVDQSLIDRTDAKNTILENRFNKPLIPQQKKIKTDADWLAQANKFTGNAFKTRQDIINWQKQNGLVGDGKFGRLSMNKWLELLRKSKDESLENVQVTPKINYEEGVLYKSSANNPGGYYHNGQFYSGRHTDLNGNHSYSNSGKTTYDIGYRLNTPEEVRQTGNVFKWRSSIPYSEFDQLSGDTQGRILYNVQNKVSNLSPTNAPITRATDGIATNNYLDTKTSKTLREANMSALKVGKPYFRFKGILYNTTR